jgi:hypothetical protein
MYNALNQAKQAAAVKREFREAWESKDYVLAGAIVRANPDLNFHDESGGLLPTAAEKAAQR